MIASELLLLNRARRNAGAMIRAGLIAAILPSAMMNRADAVSCRITYTQCDEISRTITLADGRSCSGKCVPNPEPGKGCAQNSCVPSDCGDEFQDKTSTTNYYDLSRLPSAYKSTTPSESK